jgi:hypothetical protein
VPGCLGDGKKIVCHNQNYPFLNRLKWQHNKQIEQNEHTMVPWTNQMEKGQGKLPAPGGQHHKVFQHGQQKTFAKPPGTDEQPGFSGFKKRDFSGRSPGYNS